MLGIPAAVAERWGDSYSNKILYAASAAAENEVLVYGPIVSAIDAAWINEWLGDEVVVSNKIFREQLNSITGDVVVRFNSPGGDVWEASGMMAALTERRNAGDAVNAIVDGLAASAASLVMLAAGDIRVAPMASLVIHQAQGLMYGPSQEFLKMADFLERTDQQAASLYAARMEMTKAEVFEVLKDERWFTGPEAIEAGLADGMIALEPEGETDSKDAEIFARRNLRLAALVAAAA